MEIVMNKFLLGLVVFALSPVSAHAGVLNDPGLRVVIAKHVSMEIAVEAVKAARDVRKEVKFAKKKK